MFLLCDVLSFYKLHRATQDRERKNRVLRVMDKSKATGTGKIRLHRIQKKGKTQIIQLNKNPDKDLDEIVPPIKQAYQKSKNK